MNCAGLQKNGSGDSIGKLTIDGTGSLTAIGVGSASIGGGGYMGKGTNITINGGTITVESGIGSIREQEQNANIVINGGSVKTKLNDSVTFTVGTATPFISLSWQLVALQALK